ncbi:MAG: choice-of-anchor T family protein [Thermoplasmatota archaeon]
MEGRGSSSILLLLFVLISFVPAVDGAHDNAEDPGWDPHITIVVREGPAAFPSFDECFDLTLSGYFYHNASWLPTLQGMVVRLYIDAGGWEVVQPDEFIIGGRCSRNRSFGFTVKVPTGTPSGISRQIKVNGTWVSDPPIYSGSISEGASTTIRVGPVSDPRIMAVQPKQVSIRAGDSRMLSFEFGNFGNFNDSYRWVVGNEAELLGRGWTIEWDLQEASMDRSTNISVNLSIKVPGDEKSGSYHLNVTLATSSEAVKIDPDPSNVIIEVKVQNDGWDPVRAAAAVISLLLSAVVLSTMVALTVRSIRKKKLRSGQ